MRCDEVYLMPYAMEFDIYYICLLDRYWKCLEKWKDIIIGRGFISSERCSTRVLFML